MSEFLVPDPADGDPRRHNRGIDAIRPTAEVAGTSLLEASKWGLTQLAKLEGGFVNIFTTAGVGLTNRVEFKWRKLTTSLQEAMKASRETDADWGEWLDTEEPRGWPILSGLFQDMNLSHPSNMTRRRAYKVASGSLATTMAISACTVNNEPTSQSEVTATPPTPTPTRIAPTATYSPPAPTETAPATPQEAHASQFRQRLIDNQVIAANSQAQFEIATITRDGQEETITLVRIPDTEITPEYPQGTIIVESPDLAAGYYLTSPQEFADALNQFGNFGTVRQIALDTEGRAIALDPAGNPIGIRYTWQGDQRVHAQILPASCTVHGEYVIFNTTLYHLNLETGELENQEATIPYGSKFYQNNDGITFIVDQSGITTTHALLNNELIDMTEVREGGIVLAGDLSYAFLNNTFYEIPPIPPIPENSIATLKRIDSGDVILTITPLGEWILVDEGWESRSYHDSIESLNGQLELANKVPIKNLTFYTTESFRAEHRTIDGVDSFFILVFNAEVAANLWQTTVDLNIANNGALTLPILNPDGSIQPTEFDPTTPIEIVLDSNPNPSSAITYYDNQFTYVLNPTNNKLTLILYASPRFNMLHGSSPYVGNVLNVISQVFALSTKQPTTLTDGGILERYQPQLLNQTTKRILGSTNTPNDEILRAITFENWTSIILLIENYPEYIPHYMAGTDGQWPPEMYELVQSHNQ